MVGRRIPADRRVVGRHKPPQKRAITTLHLGRFFFTPTSTCADSTPRVNILLVSSDCAHCPSSALVGQGTIRGSLAIALRDTNDNHRGGMLHLETLRRKSPAGSLVLIEIPMPSAPFIRRRKEHLIGSASLLVLGRGLHGACQSCLA